MKFGNMGYAGADLGRSIGRGVQALFAGPQVREQAAMQAGLMGAQTAKFAADARNTDYLTDMRQNPDFLKGIEALFGQGAALAYQAGGNADKFGTNAMELQKYQFRSNVLGNIGDPGTDQSKINMATAMLEGKTHTPYSAVGNTGHVLNQESGEMHMGSPGLFNTYGQNTQANRQQVVDTPGGLMIVDPSTGTAFPATGANGAPLQGQKAFDAQAAARNQEAVQVQDTLGLQKITGDMDRMAKLASEIMNSPDLYRATGALGVLPDMPGSESANLTAKLNTLKNIVGFGVLQAMREASKTGGALGAVSDRENEMLQNALIAMDYKQSPAQLRGQLRELIDYTQRVKAQMSQAYVQNYGAMPDNAEFSTNAPLQTEQPHQSAPPAAAQAGSEDPRMAEIRRRAQTNPEFAERARQMGLLP